MGRDRMVALLAGLLTVLALGAAPTVSAASVTPRFLTNASTSTMVGLAVFDHTNLTDGASPSGTITFRLFGPGDSSCATAIFTSTVAVSGTGSDDSGRFWTTQAGNYQWTAVYNGDARNNAVGTVCGDPSESVVVGRRYAAVTLTAEQSAGVIHAALAVSGGMAPSGTATFTVTGPGDQFCLGAAAFTSTVAVHGRGVYDSGGFRPTSPGTYSFRVRYSGDVNNYGVGPTGCVDQSASVVVAQAVFTNPPDGAALDVATALVWAPVSTATQYGLMVGTSRGGYDLVNTGLAPGRSSYTVAVLPVTRTLYARLWTSIAGGFAGYDDVSFTTLGQGAQFTSPLDGQTGAPTRMRWATVAGAGEYGLWVGTKWGASDLARVYLPPATSSYDLSTLPVGQKIYARIWTALGGVWARYQDMSFTR